MRVPSDLGIDGLQVGHWTGQGTGVTVVVCPPGTTGSAEVRGGAPATREVALLDPARSVGQVDAIVLTGGSAFGLASVDGVVRALAEAGRGFPTRGGPVPIVPAAAVYDLVDPTLPATGDVPPRTTTSNDASSQAGEAIRVPPGAEEGRSALRHALAASERGADVTLATGRVGAGTGAHVGKWLGSEHAVPGGLGAAVVRDGDLVVSALAVVNAVGDVIAEDGTTLAGSRASLGTRPFPDVEASDDAVTSWEHTTLVVVATNATLSKVSCRLVAESAQHGIARAIEPSHTRHDGDVAFALATGAARASIDLVRVHARRVVSDAIRDAVTSETA